MADEPMPQPLDYRRAAPKRAKYVEDAEERRWRDRRIQLRVGIVVALFPAIALYFGPNLILFGKWTRISAADFASEVDAASISTVRAMKEYQRDTGTLPNQVEDLMPRYLSAKPPLSQLVSNGTFMQFAEYSQRITYDFSPGAECWKIRGAFVSGSLPLAPVTIGPATQPISTSK